MKRVLLLLLVLFALTVLAAVGIGLYVRSMLASASEFEEIWLDEVFAGLAPLERFPRREENATARRLEEIGTALGIDFTTPHRPDLVAPDPEDAERFEALKGSLREWLVAASAAKSHRLPGYPEQLEDYMRWADALLGEAEEALLGMEPPAWSLDLPLGHLMPLPNLVAQLQLHRLLSLRALGRARAGASDAADRGLEAAARLREGAASSPVLISQLIAIAQAGSEQLVLRRLCSPDERWLRRIESTEFQSRVLAALQLEAWAIRQGLERTGEVEQGGLVLELGLIGHAEAMQHAVERLRRQDPRTFESDSFFEEESGRIPRWNFMARVMFPNLGDSWLKAVRIELGSELTAAILRARGREGFPASNRVESAVIPDDFWSVRSSPETTTMKFQSPMPELLGPQLSLEYSWSPADCAAEPGQALTAPG